MTFDPVPLEILNNKIAAATDEMCATPRRASRSNFVKEAADFGAGIVDTKGRCFARCRTPEAKARAVIGRVPDAVIEQIRNQCADDVFVQEEPAFRPGERVHIVDGPCRGLQAIFQRVTSSTERVMILLEIMENVAQVEIARSQIVTAES